MSIKQNNLIITGLPGRPSHKMGFRSVSKSGHPGEGKHEGLVPRNDVLRNGFIGFSLARSLARILFVPCLRSPWTTHKALRTWRRLFALFEAIRPWESFYNFFLLFEFKSVRWCWRWETQRNARLAFKPTRRSRKVHTKRLKRWLWASGLERRGCFVNYRSM